MLKIARGENMQSFKWRLYCTFYRPMKWTESHDILLPREVYVSSIYETRNGSVERGKEYDIILENLYVHNSLRPSGQYRIGLIYLSKETEPTSEKKGQSSEINPDDDEIDSLLEEICDKEERMLILPITSKVKKAENDKATAEETRLQAMETVGDQEKK